jgi:hypothetical protein
MVAISRGRAKHGAMLLVHDRDDRGQERVIILPLGSVVSYFTSRDDAPGVVLHLQPGFYALPGQFEAQRAEVRDAVLAEAARRLLVPPEEVVNQSLVRLKEVADPDVLAQLNEFSRRRSKGRNGPFSR